MMPPPRPDSPAPDFAALQRPPDTIPGGFRAPMPLLFDRAHQPITTPERWLARRAELRDDWIRFLGTIPASRAVGLLSVLATEHLEGGVLRERIRYETEPGLAVEAYLLRPAAEGPPRPGVAVFHSTTADTIRQPAGLTAETDKAIGLQFARRGFVAICPRCFLWEYAPADRIADAVAWLRRRHPSVRGMAKMLLDATRAVDVLAALPQVDSRRLGAIGHSLGAKETLYLAAFDDRIRAAVFSEGGIGLDFSNWEAPWYLGPAIREPGFGLDHAQVLGLIAPRAFLIIGGDSADGAASWPHVAAGLPLWKLLDAPSALGLSNHHQGHAYPPAAQQLALDWLAHFLAA